MQAWIKEKKRENWSRSRGLKRREIEHSTRKWKRKRTSDGNWLPILNPEEDGPWDRMELHWEPMHRVWIPWKWDGNWIPWICRRECLCREFEPGCPISGRKSPVSGMSTMISAICSSESCLPSWVFPFLSFGYIVFVIVFLFILCLSIVFATN